MKPQTSEGSGTFFLTAERKRSTQNAKYLQKWRKNQDILKMKENSENVSLADLP